MSPRTVRLRCARRRSAVRVAVVGHRAQFREFFIGTGDDEVGGEYDGAFEPARLLDLTALERRMRRQGSLSSRLSFHSMFCDE
jgi:hypothetical protein